MIFETEPTTWVELQDYVAKLFEECGFYVESPKTIQLIRGKKEIDVYVSDNQSEFQSIILIECKYWQTPVNQDVIHSFRTIVNDFGGNVGFIVSKNGFQSGSYDAIEKTNINLVSLKDLEKKYFERWLQKMNDKYLPLITELFPYWTFYKGKKPQDGKALNLDNFKLLRLVYTPIFLLDPYKNKLEIEFPIQSPKINDNFKIIGTNKIENYRQYFNFIDKNKENALKHFKILYGEK